MYMAPGLWLTNPLGRNFDVNRNILSLRSFFASFKKNSLKSDFRHLLLLLLFHTCIEHQGRGKQPPGDTVLMSTEISFHFIHLLQVLKKMSLKSDFIHFFFMI